MDAKKRGGVISLDELYALHKIRQTKSGSAQARMAEIQQLYYNELTVALPELNANERVVAANLLQLGADQMGRRLASVVPAIKFALDRQTGEASKERARLKRDVIYDWWSRTRLTSHMMQKRGRWYFAFGVAPVVLRPDNDGLPCWYERHPLGTYPAPTLQVGDICPPNVIFNFKRGVDDLARIYPQQMARIKGRDDQHVAMYDVLEYDDDEEVVYAIVGNERHGLYGGSPIEELHRIPNRTGRSLCVIPGRIGLDEPLGQFDGIVGAYQLQARLMALYTIGVEKSIFREEWVQSLPNGQGRAKIVTTADPFSGRIGEIENGTLQVVDVAPSPVAPQLINQLEYVERASGAIPAEFSGQSQSNVRTGRRGDSIMSAAVDFTLQEAQEIFQASLEEENRIAIAIAKAYAGAKTFSMNVPDRGTITYTPSTDLQSDEHTVRYAYAGADANTLTIAVGQKLGLETISRETAMELDPLVTDVEVEKDRIVGEGLERAFLSSIQTQAADPNGPYQPADLARLISLVKDDKMDLPAAVTKVHEEAQARQQAQQQAQVPPEQMQPGLATPGAPGAPPAIEPAGPSIQNLAGLMSQLRRPQMRIAGEGAPIAQPQAVQ